MINISKPDIGQEEISAVEAVLRTGMLAQGKKTEEFEQKFAAYSQSKHGIAFSNGTTALHSALYALGVGPGDEVIVPTFSFISSSNSVLMQNAKPVFVDMDADTFNMSADAVAAAITPKTKAIMPVHLFGQAADMDALRKAAGEIPILEDACQAHGAEYDGKRAGSLGTIGCFSFYATKNITTGEGGMATTQDDAFSERMRMFRNHGMKERYKHEQMGYNYRITDIGSAIGVAQLAKLDSFNDKRRRNAALYDELLKNNSSVVAPKVMAKARHVYHQYTIRVKHGRRDALKDYLHANGVGSGIYYPVCLHEQPYYRKLFDYKKGDFPESEQAAQEVLSLPVHHNVSEEEVRLIAERINSFSPAGA